MPAANSMVKYVASLNSGFSSGFPSFIVPYLEKYRAMIKTAQASWVPMYIHVKVWVIHDFHSVICSFANSGSLTHKTTKLQITNAEIRVTTGFKRIWIPNFELPTLNQFQFILNHRHLFKVSSCSLCSLLESIFWVSVVSCFRSNYRRAKFSALLCLSLLLIYSEDMTGGVSRARRWRPRELLGQPAFVWSPSDLCISRNFSNQITIQLLPSLPIPTKFNYYISFNLPWKIKINH